MSAALRLAPENTVSVSHVGHRLAMGIQWRDALTRMPAGGGLLCELEAVGLRPLPQRLEGHSESRHALRWAGRLKPILAAGAEDKATSPLATPADDQTNLALRCYGCADLRAGAYNAGNDPRRYVPRRIALTPVLVAGIPPANPANIRHAALWPGAAYPLGANATAIRGRIRRGPSLAGASIVPWARVVVTRPLAPPDFDAESKVGWAHGDDRGEFLAVLGAQAVPGGAILPQAIALRVWVFLPPAAATDPQDPLSRLPLEQAGSDPDNDVLRGIAPPADYVRQAPVDLTLRPGEVFVMSDALLLFA